mmetsp:Transcript_19805/g.33734  ORF Transcript_19805/g.33734 Transcript_19805/m.33734 type:complete len:87 (+) Transcript_19805:1270-1530(+)
MSVFVTVGTTLFEDLISTIQEPSICKELSQQGFKQLNVQYGKGKPPTFGKPSLETNSFDFQPSILQYINDAELVISHGGTKDSFSL